MEKHVFKGYQVFQNKGELQLIIIIMIDENDTHMQIQMLCQLDAKKNYKKTLKREIKENSRAELLPSFQS